jgi:hypothetical protein
VKAVLNPSYSRRVRSEVVETEAGQGATTKAYSCRTVRRSDTAMPTVSATAVGHGVNKAG